MWASPFSTPICGIIHVESQLIVSGPGLSPTDGHEKMSWAVAGLDVNAKAAGWKRRRPSFAVSGSKQLPVYDQEGGDWGCPDASHRAPVGWWTCQGSAETREAPRRPKTTHPSIPAPAGPPSRSPGWLWWQSRSGPSRPWQDLENRLGWSALQGCFHIAGASMVFSLFLPSFPWCSEVLQGLLLKTTKQILFAYRK